MTREKESQNHEEKRFPSQGVPTKIDPRVLPLLRALKEWAGIKQYRMVMVWAVNEMRRHLELVAALPPHVREGLEGLEADLAEDLEMYAAWDAAAQPARGKKGRER